MCIRDSGTIRAFDGTGSPPIDMGVVGGTSSTFRGRVAAMCVVDDELLVSGCHDGRVVVHDARVPSAPKIAQGEPLPGKVHDVCALEDGRILVAGEFGLVAYENARGRDGRLVVVDDESSVACVVVAGLTHVNGVVAGLASV